MKPAITQPLPDAAPGLRAGAPAPVPEPAPEMGGLDVGAVLDTLLATGATHREAAVALLGCSRSTAPGDNHWMDEVQRDPILAQRVGEALLSRPGTDGTGAILAALDIGLALPDATWIRPAMERSGLWVMACDERSDERSAMLDAVDPRGGWLLERSILARSVLNGWRSVAENAFAVSSANGVSSAARAILVGLRRVQGKDQLRGLAYLGRAAQATPEGELSDLVAWLGRRGFDPICAAMAAAHPAQYLEPAFAQALATRMGADSWWTERIYDCGIEVDGATIDAIPEGMKVIPGNLEARNCPNLKRLPDGLIVDGNLILDGCGALEALPGNLSILAGGGLFLDGCVALRALPDGLFVDTGTDFGLSMQERPPLPLPEYAALPCDRIFTDAFNEAAGGTDVASYRAWTAQQGL